ncbi:putative phosphorylase [Alternaria alternata]|nr:putative phosphorylase [Alternaria alternata]
MSMIFMVALGPSQQLSFAERKPLIIGAPRFLYMAPNPSTLTCRRSPCLQRPQIWHSSLMSKLYSRISIDWWRSERYVMDLPKLFAWLTRTFR